MRLADFLDRYRDAIVDEAAEFAKSLPSLKNATDETLRDHFAQCLEAIATDIRAPQSRTQAIEKSQGKAPRGPATTAAEEHGVARANSGLTTSQLVSEYRALRASVLRLWLDHHADSGHIVDDITRFNEAVDQALAESIVRFEEQVDSWRHIFLGVVGHDLRTPLNAMALTGEVLRIKTPEALHRHVDVVAKGTKRIGSMLDSLLEYSNSQVGTPMPLAREEASLCAVSEDELEIVRAAFPEAQIDLHCEGPGNGVFDVSRVREALSNLVSNAVQHGTDRSVQVDVREDGDQLVVTVRNRGEIPEAALPGIFEPMKRGQGYQTGHRTNLGLGLFICKQIVDAHGGQITARSENGMVEVTMKLPASGAKV